MARIEPVRLVTAALLCLASACALPGGAVAASQGEDEQQAEIVEAPPPLREAHARWRSAASAGDAEGLAALYSATALLEPPCSLLRPGPRTPLETWKALFAMPNMSVGFDPLGFEPRRGMTVEHGRAQYLHLVGGIPYGTNVAYRRVWRELGGKWLIAAEWITKGGECERDSHP
jgi:hypothetical protein